LLDKWCIFMRLLRPSARGIGTYFSDDYSYTHLRRRSSTRGADVYFGDDYFGLLHPRRHGSNRGVRHLLRRLLLQHSPSSASSIRGARRLRSSTRGADVYFGDDYFGIHPRHLVRLAELVVYLYHHFTFDLAIRFEWLAVYLNIICFDCE
jgi:hypothetical protein